MNEIILEKNAEELFLILLSMKNSPFDNSTEDLLMMNDSLNMVQYLDDKANNIEAEFPKLEYHFDDNKNCCTNQRLNNVYQRLLNIANLYENTRN